MLFFAVAILLCAVRDAQCKTRESPKNLWLEKKEGMGGEGGWGQFRLFIIFMLFLSLLV